MGLLYTQSAPQVPTEPYPDLAHAPNFQRFDGLTLPETSGTNENQLGTNFGATPRPGQRNTPTAQQTYTKGPIVGTVGTIGGQPLPVANWLYRVGRGFTASNYTQRIQHRLGVGQAYQGAAQTVALSEITSNPPQPGDLSSIISGWA
jgi:hypothetical protein